MVVFLPWFLLFLLDLSPVVPGERLPEADPEIGLEAGPETTLSILPGGDVLDLPFPVVPCLAILSSFPSNPLFKSNPSHPHIYSPMVTFNEPSENVKGMFSFVHSYHFSPGANNKLLLSSLIKR